MALWLFPSPQIVRIQRALEDQPVFSLWTRVKRDIPSTVLLRSDAVTWEEWPGASPQLHSPSAKYHFGARGFSTMGTDQSAWDPPKRFYVGGHNYVIDDTLKAELIAAVTSLAPTGYGAYIIAAPPGSVFTGDEVMLSGYADMGEHPHE